MENYNQDQLKEEEVPNIEQFQVGRSPSTEEDELNREEDGAGYQNAADADSGYTDQEVQFADGKDTQLNQQAQGPEEDEDDDDIIVDDPEDDEINIDDPDDDPDDDFV